MHIWSSNCHTMSYLKRPESGQTRRAQGGPRRKGRPTGGGTPAKRSTSPSSRQPPPGFKESVHGKKKGSSLASMKSQSSPIAERYLDSNPSTAFFFVAADVVRRRRGPDIDDIAVSMFLRVFTALCPFLSSSSTREIAPPGWPGKACEGTGESGLGLLSELDDSRQLRPGSA